MQSYLSGKYWWLGVAAIVALTLIFYHGLVDRTPVSKPAPIVERPVKQVVRIQRPVPPHPVLDLFNPSTQSISHDQAISRVRSELEQLFVIRILLERCEIISDIEAQSVRAAGLEYATRSKLFADSPAVVAELESQAQQTHDLVYSGTSCSEDSLQALKTQTLDWQAQFTR